MATMKVVPKAELAMKAARVPKAGADFEIFECPIPEPDAGQVRIKVKACGICHSDVLVKVACCLGFSILVCRDRKLRASLTRLDPASPCGRQGSVLESAGMAGTTAPAGNAGAETFGIAET
jgi:hypothetical protein